MAAYEGQIDPNNTILLIFVFVKRQQHVQTLHACSWW